MRPTLRAPRTLTSRLVVTVVGLVAVATVLIALISTLALQEYLTSQRDDQVRDTRGRFLSLSESAGRGDGDADNRPPPGGDGRRGPFSPGTLLLTIGGSSATGGITDERGYADALSAKDLAAVRREISEGSPEARTVSLHSGDYRVVSETRSGVTLVVGLPLEDVHEAVESMLLRSLLLALAGVVLAGLVGTVLVRRQLRPLRHVAATAYEVSTLPLQSGDTDIDTRVEPALTDETTEVGRVGSALNTLLDHVEASLAERHRSEQQVRQFVADASHELRTPLSTIHGYAELSRRTPDDAEQLSAAMAKVETEATRMAALVGDLLLLARLDSGRPLERQEVDLTHLLLEAVNDARVVAPEHAWRIDLPDEPLTVTGDELRLHQVVTNLINNARRHTPAGTTVTVGAEQDPDGWSVVRVHDDGPGLSPQLQERAFERFTRGDEGRTRDSGPADGAGLGLSLVQAITQAHGGTASVVSRPGDTTFSLRLP